MKTIKRDTVDSSLDLDDFMNDLDTTLQDVAEFDPTLPELGPNPELFGEAFKDFLTHNLKHIIRIKIDGDTRYVVDKGPYGDMITFNVSKYGDGTATLSSIRILTYDESDEPYLEPTQFGLTYEEHKELGMFFITEIQPVLEDLRRSELIDFMQGK